MKTRIFHTFYIILTLLTVLVLLIGFSPELYLLYTVTPMVSDPLAFLEAILIIPLFLIPTALSLICAVLHIPSLILFLDSLKEQRVANVRKGRITQTILHSVSSVLLIIISLFWGFPAFISIIDSSPYYLTGFRYISTNVITLVFALLCIIATIAHISFAISNLFLLPKEEQETLTVKNADTI